ncbi:hypothetical protein SCL_0744 [Sulfuricaulis limicola]|uniref:Uncharacterized protein n=2 Tax=Sulfuricaulis limicola TaxID=1620215 RepID=A0A1B4XE29_9GAMM|nr:hypothetical protein SCL_0744 [Sulfuricaulis limicola]
MVKEVADAEVARWFQRSNEADPVVTLELRIHDVAFDRLTDVTQWRAVISTEIAVRAHDSSYIYVDSLFSSGAQRGEWIKDYIGIGSEKHPPEYTRLIYRTLLIALDKALADLVLRVPELRDKK